jgi:hypothetical protein
MDMSEHDSSDRFGGQLGPAASADPAMVERAKGALMLRLGVGSPEALGLLLAWSRTANTDVGHLSEVLVRGLCRGDRDVLRAEPLLLRWLETRLRAMESS